MIAAIVTTHQHTRYPAMSLIYEPILKGPDITIEDAIAYANGLVWEEVTLTAQPMPRYYNYEDTVNGVDIYYDYGADYYFFTETL